LPVDFRVLLGNSCAKTVAATGRDNHSVYVRSSIHDRAIIDIKKGEKMEKVEMQISAESSFVF
jgi:hypothetical protein